MKTGAVKDGAGFHVGFFERLATIDRCRPCREDASSFLIVPQWCPQTRRGPYSSRKGAAVEIAVFADDVSTGRATLTVMRTRPFIFLKIESENEGEYKRKQEKTRALKIYFDFFGKSVDSGFPSAV